MTKPRVTTNPVANQYTGPAERIVEFSDPDTDGPAGGLIALRRNPRGRLTVSVYRCDPTVDVIVGRPDSDEDSWDGRLTALSLAREGLRRIDLFLDADAEERPALEEAAAVIKALTDRVHAIPTGVLS